MSATERLDFTSWMAGRPGGEPYDQDAIDAEMAARIGEAVRELRTYVGLNQTQLAAVMNANQPTIAKIETGKVLPTFSTLVRIMQVLDLHLVMDLGPDGITIDVDKTLGRRKRRSA
jgi:DNA-binding XRE family transcriptional regulator